MIRALLTTTALTALLTTGAVAQDATKMDQQTQMQTQATEQGMEHNNSSATVFNPDAPAMQSSDGYFQAMEGQILASTLIGKSVYTGSGEEAESVGDVNDVVLSPNGTAEAVVIGVGGFLGVGEKEVAIDFERISWTERDGEKYLTIAAAKEELDSAPEFDRSALEPDREMQTSMTEDSGEEVAGSNEAGTIAGLTTTPETADREQDTAAMRDSATEENEVVGDQAANDGAAIDPAAENDRMAANDEAMTSESGEQTAEITTDESAETNEQMAANAVDPSVLSAEELIGTAVYGANDSDLGEVNDVIVSPEGELVAYIIDVGGFLGLGEKPVALDVKQLQITKTEDGELEIRTSMTEDELKSYPTYSEDAYKANPDAVLVR